MYPDVTKLATKSGKRLFTEITRLIPDVENYKSSHVWKFKADGFMDLTIELLSRNDNNVRISMTHYFEQNGDLMPDPDMEIFLSLEEKIAIPMSIQHASGYHSTTFTIRGQVKKRELQDQIQFLSMWLRNIKHQGHQLVTDKDEEK